ncbi:hypothetical protein ZOD2009_01035 [Haladaptatus paucihalophilus DX253]|uniref:Uncharacterized protein n=1 Tax=Haladaptatus paucihalophilus DX253 TaxID=797209 RepID=E7QP31_HALPU|nr:MULTISPECIES: hypothetical protein [Haladaptatus]EFW93684.1 hypothetical protein ZOD2009_01035 [Haladaptatus paucihalophilus DX253]GKZ15017.1 hypothetical protein HAL_28980 [Haladaptatus sp. T7]SHL47811.1 hypothetical protein SAMN05444342_3908 [Haladaptatus paucihalophilus DX253]
MPETGDEEGNYAERIAANADAEKDAWGMTLEDMNAMADDLESEGWDVVTVPASHTAPENPDAGDTDRFGFVYVIPDNYAEDFSEAVEAGTFPKYQVFRKEVGSRVFQLTQFLDPDTETAILIAGSYEMMHAPPLVKTAMEEDEMFSHVQTLDGTVHGSFRHDDYTKFFPEPEKYEDYVVEANVGTDDE